MSRLKNKASLDKKIDQFCQTSSELLSSIHTRCGDLADAPVDGRAKKERKKRQKKSASA